MLVLKHGILFLLTDAFGDIHSDWRGLGLYLGDTRFLSHYEVRLNGERPVLLHGAIGALRGTIQLTNPDLMRNPDASGPGHRRCRRQSLGIVRERVASDGVRKSGPNRELHAPRDVRACRADLDADFADIFEVRG